MIEWIEQHPEELENIREAKLNWFPDCSQNESTQPATSWWMAALNQAKACPWGSTEAWSLSAMGSGLMFCEPKLGALGNPKVAYQLVIINDLKEIFSSIADAIFMTCSQLWCTFQCWFRISHIQTILTLGDPIVICPSWEGTDPRCGKALCWPKEWFFITVDSVETGESTCNFGLYCTSYNHTRYLYFLILFGIFLLRH